MEGRPGDADIKQDQKITKRSISPRKKNRPAPLKPIYEGLKQNKNEVLQQSLQSPFNYGTIPTILNSIDRGKLDQSQEMSLNGLSLSPVRMKQPG